MPNENQVRGEEPPDGAWRRADLRTVCASQKSLPRKGKRMAANLPESKTDVEWPHGAALGSE